MTATPSPARTWPRRSTRRSACRGTRSAELVEDGAGADLRRARRAARCVKISSFGTFSVRQKGERIGRNPKTGEEVPILPRRVLVFRASPCPEGPGEQRRGAKHAMPRRRMSRRGRRRTTTPPVEPGRAAPPQKSPNAFRTISEVADELHVPQHVLRFWETKFPGAAAQARRRPALLPARGYRRCCAGSATCSTRATRSRACSGCCARAACGRPGRLRPQPRPKRGGAPVPLPKACPGPGKTRGAAVAPGKSELKALVDELTGLRDQLRRLAGR